METLYADMVLYTSLFIQKYAPIIQTIIPNSVRSNDFVSYSYSSDLRSQVCFNFDDDSYYQFTIDPEQKRIYFQYVDKNKTTFTLADYKKMVSIIPFASLDYNKVYEIFDFLEQDDLNYDSIGNITRYNSISFYNSDSILSLNAMLVTYDIKYKEFYRKIHKKSKIRTFIDVEFCFDNEMNISVNYSFEILLTPKRAFEISVQDNNYICNNSLMTKDELFTYIKNERQSIIQEDLNKILKKSSVNMDIEFNEKFKDQLKVIEMVMI